MAAQPHPESSRRPILKVLKGGGDGDDVEEYVDWLAAVGYLAAILAPPLGVGLAVPIVIRGDWRNFAGVLTAAVASFLIRLAFLGGWTYTS